MKVLHGKVILVERNPREPRTLYVGEIETFDLPSEKYKFDSTDVAYIDRATLNLGDKITFFANGTRATEIRLCLERRGIDFWDSYWGAYSGRTRQMRDLILVERPR